jgi:aminopeptidase N
MSPAVVECFISLIYLPLHLLLQGMDLYFQRHDGQAVTCEDFYAAMCDANNAQLPNFLQW